MLEEELTSIGVVLEGAAERIQDKELKALVSRCCGNIAAAAEQARALENGLPNGHMELRTERVEILLPQADLRLVAQDVKLSGLIAVGMAGEGR